MRKHYGVITHLIKNLYENSWYSVRTNAGRSKPFIIKYGGDRIVVISLTIRNMLCKHLQKDSIHNTNSNTKLPSSPTPETMPINPHLSETNKWTHKLITFAVKYLQLHQKKTYSRTYIIRQGHVEATR